MYKKPFIAQGQNLLSKKDLKTLKNQVSEQYPGLGEKDFDALLPEGQAKVVKLDNRCLLYSAGDSAPCFFDAEGRGELYPTLHTLWQHPYMMMELTIHPPVSKFVLNGADLMLPGVIVPANGIAGIGTVAKGQARCIKIEGNPYPIAVGKMLVNQTQMEKLKGKGMEVLHVYKDTLWAHCGKAVPNAGFSEKEDEITPCSDSSWKPGAAPVDAAAAPSKEGEGSADASQAPPPADGAPATSTAAGSGKAAADWTQDDLLDFTFLQALKLTLSDDKALPIEASELYEKHMKPARPEGTTIDVKKSSHKQIGKYLNAMRKAKAIDVTEKKGVIFVSKVDRGHKTFAKLEEKFAADIAAASSASAENAAATDEGPATSAGLAAPTITAMWKPSHYTEVLFKAVGKSKSDLYTWDQARAVLVSYVEKEGLGKGDEGPVKMNEELVNALLKAAGGQKKDQTWPEEVDFEELEDKLQERMQEHSAINVTGVGTTTRKGPPVKIDVQLSKKGAHNVTKVFNLEAYGLDPVAMGDELKKKLNCTIFIEDLPGKNAKDKMLQVQGHVDKDLVKYLEQKYGITKSFFSVK
eukprot:TRINITY_DN26701_c0_g2_i1.p1 TRINITY_DN26701_c0_g2~~TRINITY_DN26701_c0_g2_i1.p1  ORF type:complete len:580 (-),score=135.25 TRINITY_DN26701_c0_g2_i1:194-1933(-)